MDAVILAAGKNERLEGVCAPYHKPLLVVNGRSLIGRLLDQLMPHLSSTSTVAVVVAPSNVGPIVDILRTHVRRAQLIDFKQLVFIVQPDAGGPGQALALGLGTLGYYFNDGRVAVLCADNLIDDDDARRVYVADAQHNGGELVVCGAQLSFNDAKRFTRYHHEKFYEHEEIEGALPDRLFVWLGPLIGQRRELCRIFNSSSSRTAPTSIGRALNQYTNNVVEANVHAVDVGTVTAAEDAT
jgi:bifunctional N-acetylglucosamine-1-phosphate-uridyltransferase/glucosamine-1-phosphate-acetyltransferase GlmU-like protein